MPKKKNPRTIAELLDAAGESKDPAPNKATVLKALAARQTAAKKKNKYGAVKTEVDGITFDSKREAARYRELKLRLQGGEIEDLRLQIPFPLLVNEKKLGNYIADFVYQEGGQEIVEDCKGFRTPMYRWKKKHMLAQYGITLRES